MLDSSSHQLWQDGSTCVFVLIDPRQFNDSKWLEEAQSLCGTDVPLHVFMLTISATSSPE